VSLVLALILCFFSITLFVLSVIAWAIFHPRIIHIWFDYMVPDRLSTNEDDSLFSEEATKRLLDKLGKRKGVDGGSENICSICIGEF
jgi:hypothetical protein